MTSSPCSSSIDEPLTNLSSFNIPLYQTQHIYSTKYNQDDENDESASSSKENYQPINYYSESMSTTATTTANNVDNDNDYNGITNGIYLNTAMQSNEHFSYSSNCWKKRRTDMVLISLIFLFLDMYNPYYQSFPHHTMSDYNNTTPYNTNYGLISYDSSYLSYPATNFNYMNENYPLNQ